MAGMSDYFEENMFNHMLRNQAFSPPSSLYFSLHKGDPLDDNSGANEVSGSDDAAYARQLFTLAAWSAGAVASGGAITFPTVDGGSPGYTATHFGIYDAVSGGNLLWSGVLGTPANPQPAPLVAGNTYSINTGSLVLQAD